MVQGGVGFDVVGPRDGPTAAVCDVVDGSFAGVEFGVAPEGGRFGGES